MFSIQGLLSEVTVGFAIASWPQAQKKAAAPGEESRRFAAVAPCVVWGATGLGGIAACRRPVKQEAGINQHLP